jgi:enoyl-CoA hydratase/carnithine racemase
LDPVDRVVPPETLVEAADALVHEILANVPLAMQAIRAIAVRGWE